MSLLKTCLFGVCSHIHTSSHTSSILTHASIFCYWIRHLYLIGVQLGEDQSTIINKDTCLKEIRLYLQTFSTTLHSIMSAIGRTYVFNKETNKHALSITITKPKNNWYCKFAYATQVLLLCAVDLQFYGKQIRYSALIPWMCVDEIARIIPKSYKKWMRSPTLGWMCIKLNEKTDIVIHVWLNHSNHCSQCSSL